MTTEPLPIETDGDGIAPGVVVVRLEQPGRPVVVLDAALMDRLEAALTRLPADAKGVVLASASARAFVAGADLKAVATLPDPDLHAYLERGSRVFRMISALPVPTAAAIGGAALGGGLELAMHCDALIGAPGIKPYPVGLPEAGLGICPGWGGTNLLPARINAVDAIRRTATGTPMTFPEAVEAGLFDEVAGEGEDVVALASRWVASRAKGRADDLPARWIGRSDADAAARAAEEALRAELGGTGPGRAALECVAAGLNHGWDAAIKAEQRHLVALRHTPEAKASIEAFFARSSAKPGS